LTAPPAARNANFYSIQMNGFSQTQSLQLKQNKALHFFDSVPMNAFLAPPILQFTQSKLLHHKSLHSFYSIQMIGQ